MSNPKGKPSRSKASNLAEGSSGTIWIVATVVVVIVLAGVIAVVVTRSNSTSTPGGGDAAKLLGQITAVSAAQSDAVGKGTTSGQITPIQAPALTKEGKPLVLYVGAEYCPYCAAQRWAMVMALSRFGTISNLTTTSSSSKDVFPSTPTFSFHGASYSSTTIAFAGYETQDRDQKTLDSVPADLTSVVSNYNTGGGIPFIDYGGKFASSGAGYQPDVLQGKTWDEIAAALSNPGSDVAKAIIGTANVMTATICTLTGNQPANVCTPAIQALAPTAR